jgi:purine nucleosidase
MIKRVLIDADPATGIKFKDIDDGLAFLLLMSSPQIHIEGITINFGNVKAPVGFVVANKVLDVARRDIPVYKGAESKNDLGKPNRAVEFLLETVRKNPGEISLLALAPCTNVATSMMLDSTFAGNLKELVVMGGSINFRPFSYFGEFNFHLDSKAASVVLSAPIQKTLITMDVCAQAVFREEHLERIQRHNGRVTGYLSEVIPHWLNLNRRIFFRKKGFFPWDVVAAAYMIDPSLFDSNSYTLKIQMGGMRSGRIQRLAKCDVVRSSDGSVAVNIPLRLESERFMEMFLEAMVQGFESLV